MNIKKYLKMMLMCFVCMMLFTGCYNYLHYGNVEVKTNDKLLSYSFFNNFKEKKIPICGYYFNMEHYSRRSIIIQEPYRQENISIMCDDRYRNISFIYESDSEYEYVLSLIERNLNDIGYAPDAYTIYKSSKKYSFIISGDRGDRTTGLAPTTDSYIYNFPPKEKISLDSKAVNAEAEYSKAK